jgi:peroxiredoxin
VYVNYDNTSRFGVLPLAAAVAGYGIIFWYACLIGDYKREQATALRVGNPFPEIPLETLDGEAVTSADFSGARTLIVFFRGNFCTLCVAQLKEIRARAGRLADASVNVKFISNQPVSKSKALADRLDLPNHFEILYDRDLRAAAVLSIVDFGGTPAAMTDFPRDTVMATAVCLDTKSRIIYAHEPQNYRRRPHPDTLVAVFDGLKVPVDDDYEAPSCELGAGDLIAELSPVEHEPEMCENC